VQLQGFFVLFTSLVDLGFVSDNTRVVDVDGFPIFATIEVFKLVSFLSSFFTGIISSINSSLIVTLDGVETYKLFNNINYFKCHFKIQSTR